MGKELTSLAGQEKYRSIAKTLYRDADGALLLFDLTRRNTFENCAQWLEEFKLSSKEGCAMLVVGNKLDLIQADPSLRTVELEEA
jgi:GTPase SAR1 family protein